jgi:hypothetical protein
MYKWCDVRERREGRDNIVWDDFHCVGHGCGAFFMVY